MSSLPTDAYIPQSPIVRAALDAMGNGVMLADESGRIIYANEAADRILGAPPAEDSAEGWAEHYGILRPDGSERFPADRFTLVRALEGEETDDVEMLVRNSSHENDVFIAATGRPVRDEDGEIVGAVTIVRDITELRETEHDLRDALSSLEAVQQQKSEFTGFLVHDMKNLLNAILGNCELLLMSQVLDDEDREALMDAFNAGRTLHRMVLNLLDIQMAEDGRFEPDVENVNVLPLLEEAANTIRGRAPGVDIEIEKPADGAPLEVLADPELLRRIVINLIDNCMKYGPADGTIWLTAARKMEGMIRISVRDEGPGVPENLRDAIFESYARVERAPGRRDPTSRGLGLRFCKVATEAHGGRIWVEDHEPVGARFCVELPTAELPAAG